ncbi:hypothetical protein [Paraburkholderia sp.]|uniref:hypothetical protein n=1 Tax=Paraburkholderia sp. TaxID=1926495 RepID=UPI003C7D3D04
MTATQTYDHIPQPVKFGGTCRVIAAGQSPDTVFKTLAATGMLRGRNSRHCAGGDYEVQATTACGNPDSVEQAMAGFTSSYQDNI